MLAQHKNQGQRHRQLGPGGNAQHKRAGNGVVKKHL